MTENVEIAMIGMLGLVIATIPPLLVKAALDRHNRGLEGVASGMKDMKADIREHVAATREAFTALTHNQDAARERMTAEVSNLKRDLTEMSTRLGVLEGSVSHLSSHLGQGAIRYEKRP